ncbi:hypothetical protein [Granulosicoccus antarcticus]|uniref:Uncharacterized protein n=1 Tax=Granulosicoccus antarcticus IMCC3135 TaxID=1192854 RepID=A0A2Z2NXP1_9GAMM|nr:hypothetical protein [Granulosicoccus antarcticus]ASJ76033.1 hypothetical protein IMCC3135_29920 [Granulosicoccus antarcticus IMCC3135]
MSSKQPESIVVLDKSSRRQFMRSGSSVLLAGAAIAFSGSTLATDCDQGGSKSSSSDSDEGGQADRKDCESPNIVSQHQPERKAAVIVRKVKA